MSDKKDNNDTTVREAGSGIMIGAVALSMISMLPLWVKIMAFAAVLGAALLVLANVRKWLANKTKGTTRLVSSYDDETRTKR